MIMEFSFVFSFLCQFLSAERIEMSLSNAGSLFHKSPANSPQNSKLCRPRYHQSILFLFAKIKTSVYGLGLLNVTHILVSAGEEEGAAEFPYLCRTAFKCTWGSTENEFGGLSLSRRHFPTLENQHRSSCNSLQRTIAVLPKTRTGVWRG